MQSGRRLVEHVDDAEQIGADLRGQPQPLQLAGRERRRAAFEREVTQAEIEEHVEAGARSSAIALGDEPLFPDVPAASFRERASARPVWRTAAAAPATRSHGSRDISAMSSPANVTDSASRLQPLAVAERALGADQEARRPASSSARSRWWRTSAAHTAGAGEGAHVAGFLLALQRAPDFVAVVAGVDRHLGLFVGEQQPVAILLRQLAPGTSTS